MGERRGRPSKYDPDEVREMSVQVLIGFYNTERGQGILQRRIADDPRFVAKMRDRAAGTDAQMRAWLQALAGVHEKQPGYWREVMFRQWCLRLEPPLPEGHPRREELRQLYWRRYSEEAYRSNCQPWVEAIGRVRSGRLLALRIPPPLARVKAEEEEEYW